MRSLVRSWLLRSGRSLIRIHIGQEILDEPSASEDEEQKAGTEEEEPVVEPLTPKDVRVQLELLVLSPATLQRLKRVQKAKKQKGM
jgi:hypothetical protein